MENKSALFFLTSEMSNSRGPYNKWGRQVIRAIDIDDSVMLHSAFEKNKSLGSDINTQTNTFGYADYIWTVWIHKYLGDTALHLALKQAKIRCICQLVLTHGIDLTIKNNDGLTAADICQEVLGVSITTLIREARTILLQLIDPRKFMSIPFYLPHHRVEHEALDLIHHGRCLFTDAPVSFAKQGSGLQRESNWEYFWQFRYDGVSENTYMHNKVTDEYRSMTPKERRFLSRHWVESYDPSTKRFVNSLSGEESDFPPPEEREESRDVSDEIEYKISAINKREADHINKLNNARLNLINYGKSNAFNKITILARHDALSEARIAMPYSCMKSPVLPDITEGSSQTPAGKSIGDVWGRNAIGDVVQLVIRQKRRMEFIDQRKQQLNSNLGLLDSTGVTTFQFRNSQSSQTTTAAPQHELFKSQQRKLHDSLQDLEHPKRLLKTIEESKGIEKLKFIKMRRLKTIARDHYSSGTEPGRPSSSTTSPNLPNSTPHPKGVDQQKDKESDIQGLIQQANKAAVHDSELPIRFITELSTQSNMKYMHIGNKGIKSLAEALVNDKVITHLCLSGGRISDMGVKALATNLVQIRALIYLDLSSNAIGDEGVSSIAEAILEGSVRKEIIVNDVLTVKPIIRERHPLQTLLINHNRISVRGAEAIVHAVINSECNLKHLSLQFNLMSAEEIRQLDDRIKVFKRRRVDQLQSIVKINKSIDINRTSAGSAENSPSRRLSPLRQLSSRIYQGGLALANSFSVAFSSMSATNSQRFRSEDGGSRRSVMSAEVQPSGLNNSMSYSPVPQDGENFNQQKETPTIDDPQLAANIDQVMARQIVL